MAENNLDAMLVTERLNYQYYTGHRSEQCAVDKIRSYMFILTKDGDPTLITMPFEVAQVEQTSYITDIRTTGGLMGHPEFIIGVLKDLGLSGARIGAELGREQYLGISYLGLKEVMKGLPDAEFVDAAEIILNVRNVKSPQEIEYCRRAAIISAEAQKKTFQNVRAGMTENEVAQVLRQNLIAGGAEKLSLLCVLSGANEKGIVLLPTDRVVQKGETLGFDVGVSYKGYWSDLARTASVGDPSDELKEFYGWMMQLRHDCNMQLTAGNKTRRCNRGRRQIPCRTRASNDGRGTCRPRRGYRDNRVPVARGVRGYYLRSRQRLCLQSKFLKTISVSSTRRTTGRSRKVIPTCCPPPALTGISRWLKPNCAPMGGGSASQARYKFANQTWRKVKMKPTRRTLISAALGVAFAATSFTSAVAEGLMDKAKGGGLDVAFYNFIPYAYKDDSGKLTGTDVDILRIVLEKMGGKVAGAGATEWGALIPGVKTGRFDVVAAGMFVTPKRCAEVTFSEPTFGIRNAFLIKKGNPHNISNYESVAANSELKLAAVSGSAQVDYARTAGIADASIVQLPDNATAVAALKAGRIHAYAVSAPGVRQILSALPDADFEGTPVFSEVAGKKVVSHGAFAFRKADADFVTAFNAELKKFVGTP